MPVRTTTPGRQRVRQAARFDPAAVRVRLACPVPPEIPPRSLEHPLPGGMRDLLPEEARARRALGKCVLDRFALAGFALVTPPAFEFADVLERGLGTLDPAEVLRFVEPESGEVAALRPDVTPQIARMIATRLHDRPPPYRLAYEGTVLRRRSGRARKDRQIPQVGVELAGVGGTEGDIDLLVLAADALRATGLREFTIDLGNAGIVRALLDGLDAEVARDVSHALALKDEGALRERAEDARAPFASSLCALVRMHGGREAIADGLRVLAATPAAAPAARLLELFDAAVARGLGSHVRADLGDVRGFAYYTGTIFHIYAPGPGEAIGAGGRYDELLARFGAPMPAMGFAFDLDSLAWALRAAGVAQESDVRVVVVGAEADARVERLRARSVVAVGARDRASALAWARAWSFSHVIEGASLLDVETGKESDGAARFVDGNRKRTE
jgi:ATP phosphoribosyltransferase regulatory subunit